MDQVAINISHQSKHAKNEMTTQDEVLKLAEAAGWGDETIISLAKGNPCFTKLITLAKQSAYEDAASLLERSCPPEVYVWVAAEKIRNRAKEMVK